MNQAIFLPFAERRIRNAWLATDYLHRRARFLLPQSECNLHICESRPKLSRKSPETGRQHTFAMLEPNVTGSGAFEGKVDLKPRLDAGDSSSCTKAQARRADSSIASRVSQLEAQRSRADLE